MNQLFMPKEEKPLEELLRPKNIIPEGEYELVVAMDSSIWIIPEFGKSEKDQQPILITVRGGTVNSLCAHDGKLYDSGDYKKIFNTLTDTPVAEREHKINTVFSHKGALLDAGWGKDVRYTLQDGVFMNHVDSISAMCSHQDELYGVVDDGAAHTAIYLYGKTQSEVEMDEKILDLCSNGIDIFYTVFDPRNGKQGIYKLGQEKKIKPRVTTPFSICSHYGDVIDSNGETILETITNSKIYFLKNQLASAKNPTAMCSVPREILEDYI